MTETQRLKKILRVWFNGYIRKRDADKPCISCGQRRKLEAGHYWSTSQCPQPAMVFCEENVHGQCGHCNRWLEGNRQGYTQGLIKRYGPEILELLDIKRSVKQNPWTIFEYETMIKLYKQKFKNDEVKNASVSSTRTKP